MVKLLLKELVVVNIVLLEHFQSTEVHVDHAQMVILQYLVNALTVLLEHILEVVKDVLNVQPDNIHQFLQLLVVWTVLQDNILIWDLLVVQIVQLVHILILVDQHLVQIVLLEHTLQILDQHPVLIVLLDKYLLTGPHIVLHYVNLRSIQSMVLVVFVQLDHIRSMEVHVLNVNQDTFQPIQHLTIVIIVEQELIQQLRDLLHALNVLVQNLLMMDLQVVVMYVHY